ncbi:MAG: tetratricopeptide repeat protein [Meiothermus sp.]|nr:tetratricopeptide repeat protein [Meiothermus sp.]
MKRSDRELVALTLAGLLEHGRINTAIQLLQQQFEQCQTHQQAVHLVNLLESLPTGFAQEDGVQQLYLQSLCRARKPQRILEWFEQHTGPVRWQVYRAWALVREGRYAEALEVLRTIEAEAELDWGIFYRAKGEALFWLGQPDWQPVLEQARPHLQGAALGRMLIDLGGFLNARGRRAAARVCWAEALGYLEGDPYYLAWTHNSLGYVLLNDQPHQAEQHLLAALQISQKEGALGFRCKALAGVGAVRRSLGEWPRALHSYQKAYRAGGDGKDPQLALWGWGHTLRLMGQVEEALAKLLQARQMNPAEVWLEADLAATRLMLGERETVQESLPRLRGCAQSGQLGERGRLVLRVLEAELARQQGQLHQASELLAGLDLQSLWAREELGCFPALARMAGLEPMHKQPFRVEVRPFGRLEVRVNGRPVPIPAVSKVGELLVFLLVHGKEASLEVLLDRLGDASNKNPRKALWEVIEKLRQALGWRESVQSHGGVYTLDPGAEWVCHLEAQSYPFPSADEPSQTFMPGYYSEWVEEWRQRWLVV